MTLKKWMSAALILCLVFSLAGCRFDEDEEQERSSKRELYTMGMDLIGTMEEMVESEEYAQLLGTSGMNAVIEQVSDCALDEPLVVYEITPPEPEKLIKQMADDDFQDAWEDMSPALQEQVKKRFTFSTLVTACNGRMGSSYMAFCATYVASEAPRDLLVDETRVFVYVFDNGINVVVTFGETGQANGQFLFLEGLDDPDDAEDTFREMKCKVERINIP